MFGSAVAKKSLFLLSLNKKIKWLKFLFDSVFKAKN